MKNFKEVTKDEFKLFINSAEIKGGQYIGEDYNYIDFEDNIIAYSRDEGKFTEYYITNTEMKRHLTISKIDIKNTKSSIDVPTKLGSTEIDKKFNFTLNIEMVTSGNFEEFWNEQNPNKINLLVLNKITELLGIGGDNPIYKIDL